MNDTDFSGKTVLVVGGSSGIGNGIAQAFRLRGAQVHVWGTRPTRADYAAGEGSDLTGVGYDCVDVSDPQAIESAPAPFDTLDVLVLCQGAVEPAGEYERDGWDRVMAVNLDSPMNCCRRFKPSLQATSGSIIIVSSISAFKANKDIPAYAASKAGAASLTKSLGQAWAPLGIRVNGLAPGLVETKLSKMTTEDPQRRAAAIANIPAGRIGQPADMAGAVIFLASPLAAFVNGQTLVVDGGRTL
jgi:3-oxoacyl-[acyl-carrier protein] reductase